MSQILARGAQQSDQTRSSAAEALPIVTSYDALKAAIAASRKASIAIGQGNETVRNAILSGTPLNEAVKMTGPAAGGTVTSDTLKQYATQHGISVDKAKAFLTSQGYVVQ
jgi:Tfp pilus assembly pilus retraction ATPase PilT